LKISNKPKNILNVILLRLWLRNFSPI